MQIRLTHLSAKCAATPVAVGVILLAALTASPGIAEASPNAPLPEAPGPSIPGPGIPRPDIDVPDIDVPKLDVPNIDVVPDLCDVPQPGCHPK